MILKSRTLHIPARLKDAALQNIIDGRDAAAVPDFLYTMTVHDNVLWERRPRKMITYKYMIHVCATYGEMMEGASSPVPNQIFNYSPEEGISWVISSHFLYYVAKVKGVMNADIVEMDNILTDRRPRKMLTYNYIGQLVRSFGGRLK